MVNHIFLFTMAMLRKLDTIESRVLGGWRHWRPETEFLLVVYDFIIYLK